jgi:Histidine-specific methyltransferase, SAM-dependent
MSLTHLQPNIKTALLSDLYKTREISDNYSYYSPSIAISLNEFEADKSVAPLIIRKEKGLQADLLDYITRMLDYNKYVLFDLAETNGLSSLPFVHQLLIEEDRLARYVPVTPNPLLNRFAISNLEQYISTVRLPEKRSLQSEYVNVDLELYNFADEALYIEKQVQEEDTGSLFLLLNSRLGNSTNPRRMLKNIYDSMSSNQYLIVLQRIYRDNIEDMIVSDYRRVLNDAVLGIEEIAPLLSPDFNTFVRWDEQISGVKVGITSNTDSQFEEVSIKRHEEITFFRSVSFLEEELRNLFKTTGFTIRHIVYDDCMDHGLFLLRK